jgi:molecular chaperone GrpE (heat shock protein)
LEAELEKSVLRAQRSALSRKGIYCDDDEEQKAIWSEAEQMICRELIERMELLEDLLRRYQQNWLFPKVAEQLNLLRDSFMVLLKNHSVDRFDLEPGTELSVDSRKKIQLISVDDVEDPKLKKLSIIQNGTGKRTRVLQTLRSGYIYSKGGRDVIIRKAEVIVA